MIESSFDTAEVLGAFLKDSKVKFEDVVVGGGAALVCMGLRERTADLNVWVDAETFARLAEDHKIIVHPMVDVAFEFKPSNPITVRGVPVAIWVRKLNTYFPHQNVEGIQVFDPLTLTIHKRGSYLEVKRPAEKRRQDHKDLVALAALSADRNRVHP